MVFRFLMKFDNFLKLLCITLLFLYACTSNQLTNTADSCIIFDEKKSFSFHQKLCNYQQYLLTDLKYMHIKITM